MYRLLKQGLQTSTKVTCKKVGDLFKSKKLAKKRSLFGEKGEKLVN